MLAGRGEQRLGIDARGLVQDMGRTVIGLSYLGDIRMGIAEDGRKIDRIAAGSAEGLRRIYVPLLQASPLAPLPPPPLCLAALAVSIAVQWQCLHAGGRKGWAAWRGGGPGPEAAPARGAGGPAGTRCRHLADWRTALAAGPWGGRARAAAGPPAAGGRTLPAPLLALQSGGVQAPRAEGFLVAGQEAGGGEQQSRRCHRLLGSCRRRCAAGWRLGWAWRRRQASPRRRLWQRRWLRAGSTRRTCGLPSRPSSAHPAGASQLDGLAGSQ